MPAATRRDAAEKVVVNLLRKSGKKPEHFNEWTGIAAVASAKKSMEEITSKRDGRRTTTMEAAAPLTTFGPRNSDNAPKIGRHCEHRAKARKLYRIWEFFYRKFGTVVRGGPVNYSK